MLPIFLLPLICFSVLIFFFWLALFIFLSSLSFSKSVLVVLMLSPFSFPYQYILISASFSRCGGESAIKCLDAAGVVVDKNTYQ